MPTIPGRLISVQDRVQLTQLLRQKPERAYVTPGLIAFHIESGAIYALLAYAGKWAQYIQDVLNQYNQMLASIGALIPVFGQLSHSSPVDNTVRVELRDPTAGTVIASIDYQFQPMQVASDVDFANTIDPTEFQRYVQGLTDLDVQAILDQAAQGYAAFMTAGTPTAKQLAAAIKHSVRLAAVNPVTYIQNIQASVNKWQTELQGAAGKWRDMMNAVTAPALDFAVKVALAILPHV